MKAICKYLIGALLLVMQLNILKAQDSLQVLSLEDCIRIGLDRSTQILRSQDSLQITGAALIGSYGQFLPDLNFNSNYGYVGGANLLTTTLPTHVNSRASLMNYQLASTLNIFNGFSDYSALKASTLVKNAAQLNLDRAKQSVAFDITQTFLQIILDRRVIAYAQRNLAADTTREQQLQELTGVGRNAISDLYQQQAVTSSDKLYLIQSQDKLKNDIIMLLRKIKIVQSDRYNIAEAQPDTLPLGPEYQNVQDLITKAIDQRPDVQSSALYIKVAGWNIRNYRSGYLPKLYFEGGLLSNGGYVNQLYLNGVDQSSTLATQESPGRALFGQVYGEVSLNLSWHVFDRLYTKTNVQIAKIYQHNAQIGYDDLSVQISADIKTAYNDYLSALQQIETANRGLFAANQAFDVIQGKYNAGRATFVELSNAQITLLQAEVSKAQADISLALQKRIIDYYIGK